MNHKTSNSGVLRVNNNNFIGIRVEVIITSG